MHDRARWCTNIFVEFITSLRVVKSPWIHDESRFLQMRSVKRKDELELHGGVSGEKAIRIVKRF